ncbi:MAG: aminopeptidase N [Spirochaetales bacterium]
MKRVDYLPPAYLLDQVELTFQIFATHTLVSSHLSFRKNPEATAGALILDGDGLTTLSVRLDGKLLGAADYQLTPTTLTIGGVGEKALLEVLTRVDPAANKALSGLYQSSTMLCTQCESEGFRRITWFPDRPDVMAPYRVRLEAEKSDCPVLLSNGNRVESGDLSEGRHFAVWEDPFRKPSYLFALVAGDLELLHDTFTTASGRKVDLSIYTEHGSGSRCVWAMESLKRAMKWDEQAYGREYDLDVFHIVAVSDFNMGAMENKSLNIFNTSAVFASQEKTVDQAFIGVEAIVAHEYFHNWTGNRITCRDWFQLTLKEGLTVFRDQSFTQDLHSRAGSRIDDVTVLRSAQFAEDQSPMAHPIRPEEYEAIDNFYTVTVYEKGAEVIGMLKTFLGPPTYRKATDLYFDRHDGQAVTCEDFVKCMEDASGRDLTQFRRWYSQAGTPLAKARSVHEAATKTWTLTLAQSFPTHPANLPVPMPVRLGLLGADGRELPLNAAGDTEVVLTFDRAEQTFVFANVDEPPVPSLFRHFSAPIRLETDLTDADLAFLLAHDTDGFNRHESGFTLKKQDLLARIEAQKGGRPSPKTGLLVDLLGGVPGDPKLSPDLKARLLSLPTQSYLEQVCDPVDPLAIDRALAQTRLELAKALQPGLRAAYSAHHRVAGAGFPTDAEMADRAMKNLALGLLGELRTEDVYDLAATQYRAATNMTDRLAALRVFRDTDRPERAELLDDFYRRFRGDKLVIDTWFAFQSSADVPRILEQMALLEQHSDCELTNPNRVRALYGSFGRNTTGFHRVDGEGYRYQARAIVKIDAFNPQIAAGLTRVFQGWKRCAEPYLSLQKAALESLAARADLSANVAELVGKYLG